MTPVLFSVSYAGYWGQHTLSIEEFIRKAAALGYPAVELGGKRPHLSILDYATRESVAAIRRRGGRCGNRNRHDRRVHGLHGRSGVTRGAAA